MTAKPLLSRAITVGFSPAIAEPTQSAFQDSIVYPFIGMNFTASAQCAATFQILNFNNGYYRMTVQYTYAALLFASKNIVLTPPCLPVVNVFRPRPSLPHISRQMFPREGGPRGDQLGGRALEDDPAPVVSGPGAKVDDPVGVRHDRLVVLDDDHRLT